MAYRFQTRLADVLRAAGLHVVELPGWQTRGRPSTTGSFAPVGVLWHHTGSFDSLTDARTDLDYAKWLASKGRSDLPAPLCQLSISAEGTVYVCAAGRANHAGKAKASGTVAGGDGNSLYIGVECMNSGKQGWPKPQYDAMVKTGVALAGMLGTSANAQRGHKETSVTGKWDPGMLNMDKFRADIAAGIAAKSKPQPKPKPKPAPDPAILSAFAYKTPSDHLTVRARIKAGKAEFVAVTANIRGTPPMRAVNVQKCVDLALGHDVSVVGFNEMGGRDLLALLSKHAGWAPIQGPRGDQGRAPIAYDMKVWQAIDSEVVQFSSAAVKTKLGPIHVPSGNRYATVARLTHRDTGTKVAFISYHAIAHMNVGAHFGWTGRGPKALLALRGKIPNPAIAVYKQGMAALEAKILELRAAGYYVVPMGDWNVDFLAEAKATKREQFGPTETMRRAGVTTIYSAKKWRKGTAGKRGIDVIGVAGPK